MKSRDDLLEIMDGVCADVLSGAIGAVEVAERLVLVVEDGTVVKHDGGEARYEDGGVIAFVNDSGVPFVEQGDDLQSRVADLRPTAVLLGGTALTGRAESGFRKVLAVQLFSAEHDIRLARIAGGRGQRGHRLGWSLARGKGWPARLGGEPPALTTQAALR